MRGDDQRRKLSAYVRERIREETRGYGKKSKLAKKLGCSPTHITELLKGTSEAGDRLIYAVAAYWGTSMAGLEAMAGVAPRCGDPYPNRTAAAEMAAEMPWPPEAYADVLKEEPPVDPPRAAWLLKCFFAVQLHGASTVAPSARAGSA